MGMKYIRKTKNRTNGMTIALAQKPSCFAGCRARISRAMLSSISNRANEVS
jgi:predicted  nucleic acid-binding Zn-ribbon protein